MKLVTGSSKQRDTLRVLIVIESSDCEVEIVKEKGDEDIQLFLDDQSVTRGSYAICRYLARNAKRTPFQLPEGPAKWVAESLLFWTFSTLAPALDGVDKQTINSVLDYLDDILSKRSTRYIVQDEITLADIFVWSCIRASRVYSTNFLESRKAVKVYCDDLQGIAFIERACSIAFAEEPASASVSISADSPMEKFYLTTAINYTNGPPHIGHAYEAIVSDVLCRYHRTYGRDVYFLTGTDEHGQKIAQTAEKLGKEPIDICDYFCAQFKELNKELAITNDYFVRTTEENHLKVAQDVWRKSRDNGDIYLDKYVGWYNVREETFVTEFEAQESDYKDPISGVPLQKMEEESYFFRMSKYHERLVAHIEAHPEFILPDFRRNEIVARLKKEPLTDLSVSRATFSWGVPVPEDPKHVMYVWFDALVNYISAVRYGTEEPTARYWPADIHMIGKDITWFHTVIWPCILMSAGIPLPKTVFAHGFVVAGDGRKMSKSLDNILCPRELLKDYGVDTFRFFSLKFAELGRDLRCDVEAMADAHNADLADTLGNLTHRVTGLTQKFCDGKVPDSPLPAGQPPFNFDLLRTKVEALMASFSPQLALEVIFGSCRDTNKYLTDRAPWAIPDLAEKRQVVRAVLEAMYLLAHFLEPYIPLAAEAIFERLGTPKRQLRSLSSWFDNLSPGTPVTVGDILFVKRGEPSAAQQSRAGMSPSTTASNESSGKNAS